MSYSVIQLITYNAVCRTARVKKSRLLFFGKKEQYAYNNSKLLFFMVPKLPLMVPKLPITVSKLPLTVSQLPLALMAI